MSRYEQFHAFRTRLNERILGDAPAGAVPSGGHGGGRATLNTKRFFALDGACYKAGAVDARTKEMLGLAASMVLRCDDCIAYHVDQCLRAGCTPEELWEVFDVALIVGGSIVIPHLRRAVDFLDEAVARGVGPGGTGTHGGAA
ncbi:MAG: carboxymuconolactone decarboxylase family protein [Phycisphaerae bacterium]|nr:carboxymuconolactone decarboxylase family protein [Phycisphaerae bacterium]